MAEHYLILANDIVQPEMMLESRYETVQTYADWVSASRLDRTDHGVGVLTSQVDFERLRTKVADAA